MQILKRTLPERIWRRLGRNPMLVMSAVSTSIRVGRDGAALRRGDLDAPEFRKRTGGHLGSMSGGLAGAAAGAAWGSALPGFGTILGAFAGSVIGEELGGRVGRLAVEQAEITIQERFSERQNAAAQGETSIEEAARRPRRHL